MSLYLWTSDSWQSLQKTSENTVSLFVGSNMQPFQPKNAKKSSYSPVIYR